MPTLEERENLRAPVTSINQTQIDAWQKEADEIYAQIKKEENSLPRPNRVDIQQLLTNNISKELSHV